MKRVFRAICVVSILGAASTVVAADSASYTPPARVGDIYAVVRWKLNIAGTAEPTTISVKWGAWSKSATAKWTASTPTTGWYDSGVVLKLKHSKADSIPLTLTTDGTVIVKPLQGAAPAQWTNKSYQHLEW